MKEELDQLVKNETWELVLRPKDKNVNGTKWVFRNKLNGDGKVIINKARLVCKGYAQVEGVYFEKKNSLVVRIESSRILLAHACSKDIKVYQMDVKLIFLTRELKEEFYIEKLEGFLLSKNKQYVCILRRLCMG